MRIARCAAQYCTKAEKGSKSFEKLLASTLNKYVELDDKHDAYTIFASMLVQQTGGRDWTAQEVGHALLGIPTVFASHKFMDMSLATTAKLRPNIKNKPDHESAIYQTQFQRYLNRLQVSRKQRAPGNQGRW